MGDVQLRRMARRALLQVAVDGPAGAGKSTVGQGVATSLGAAYLDTGLMYRAVTWLGIQAGASPGDEEGLARLASQTEFAAAGDGHHLLINGQQMDAVLRTAAVDALVSEVSAHPRVRSALVAKQRAFADDRCVVMVGRDIGTTVLPSAGVKLWITASPEVRARRRLQEGLSGSDDFSVVEMAKRIRARDSLDASRAVSPLVKAEDAIVIDTDQLDEKAAANAAIAVVRKRLEEPAGA
jgi:cytidylate kinase